MPGAGAGLTSVLVTRAESDAALLVSGLERAGLRPVCVPLLERIHHVAAVARAAAGGHDGWVLTSAAAVEVLAAAAARPPGWVATVGPRTAARARSLGWPVDVEPDTATAAALIAALGPRHGQRVLYPRADLAGPQVRTGLEACGAVVYEVVAYQNVLPAGAVAALRDAWPVDVVTLLSGSAARRLAELEPPPWPPATRVVVIGPSTERVAREVGIPVHAVADPHTVEGVLAAIAALV